jgi:hypothetical protein
VGVGEGVGDGVGVGEGVGDGVGMAVGLAVGDGEKVCVDTPAPGRIAMTVSARASTAASAVNDGASALLVVGRVTFRFAMHRSWVSGDPRSTEVRPTWRYDI